MSNHHHHFTAGEEAATGSPSSADPFDLLPDEILLSIFNKLNDAKSLCRSMSACKRFHYVAPQVHEISYEVVISHKETPKHHHPFIRNLLKPFTLISRVISKPKHKIEEKDLDFYASYIPSRVLKPFDAVRSLHLTLPSAKLRKKSRNPANFLKWEAVFSREIKSCVIVGAKSWTENGDGEQPPEKEAGEGLTMSEEDLKLRIVWTISCLIAASARNYLVQRTLRDKETIENVVVSDESGQGSLRLKKEGIREVREHRSMGKGKASSPSTSDDGGPAAEYRSKVPALKMQMWYLDRIEQPELGKVMKGATLVVIRPAGDGDEVKKVEYADLVARAFGEDLVVGGIAKKLIAAKKCYTMEMNSF